MINKVSKGNRVELACKHELQNQGWLTESKPRTKYQSPDFWGQFDVLAIKGGNIQLVQVKSNRSDFYQARKHIKSWKSTTGVTVPCSVWLYLGNKKWRVEEI